MKTTRKALFEAATDVFQRVGSRNERLSLAYGLIACLAWVVFAPSSAMAECGPHVTSRKSAGWTDLLMKEFARPDVGLSSSLPPWRPGCPRCSGGPTLPPLPPATVPPPHVEDWAFLIAGAIPSRSGGWFNFEQDSSRPIHRTFLILHPPRPAR